MRTGASSQTKMTYFISVELVDTRGYIDTNIFANEKNSIGLSEIPIPAYKLYLARLDFHFVASYWCSEHSQDERFRYVF